MREGIYKGTRLRDDITVSEIVTIHYYEFSSDYRFGGEAHDFWEMVYVDKGTLVAKTEREERKIGRGELIFHAPLEWHSLYADGVSASSAIIISFECSSAALLETAGEVFSTENSQRVLLSEIINEAKAAFDTPLSDLVTPKLERRRAAPFGAEQIIKLNLCRLIIDLLRKKKQPVKAAKRRLDEGLFGEICAYLEENLDKNLTLGEISRHAGISKTALKQLFSERAGCGAGEYYIRLKIDRAKQYIREKNYNFTQISELLGYGSVHYFSSQFKKRVNMTPSEYASSIQALTGEAERFSGGGC